MLTIFSITFCILGLICLLASIGAILEDAAKDALILIFFSIFFFYLSYNCYQAAEIIKQCQSIKQ